MPGIMIILDGAEDGAYAELGGKTPYEWGRGAAFSEIDGNSAFGRLITTPAGFEPDTLTCILTLLGVDAANIPSGRSAIEALAIGMPVGRDDLVLRCNFVKIAADGTLEDPTCAAPPEIAGDLMTAVSEPPGVELRRVGPYKCLQRIEGAGASLDGLVTFPPHNYAGKPLEEVLPRGNTLADSLAETSRRLLEIYRPYTVLNWAHSARTELPQFAALHGGASGAMVSATHAPMGAAIAMGMACPVIPGATGDVDTDLGAKLSAALGLLETNDFVMLHIGGPDEATHRFNPREKAEFMRRLDGELVAPLLAAVPDGTGVMVTCDHMAFCSTGGHSADPVAFRLYKKGGKMDGDLGLLDGRQAVGALLDIAN